jgi:hypothetical protein
MKAEAGKSRTTILMRHDFLRRWRCRYCELKASSETTAGFRAAMEASRIDLTSSGTSLTEATATKYVGKRADVDTRSMDD